ncbi:hypothetical protein GCM10022384_49240 [Streptomyces marokkonensis]|uniref:Uncharacterized protein n=1 Tax=Streptomyces marokkonensis TaxID=324855 RepID=A0ABP7RDX7_9ACTN
MLPPCRRGSAEGTLCRMPPYESRLLNCLHATVLRPWFTACRPMRTVPPTRPVLAVMAPVLVWLAADPLLGHRLRIADGEGTLVIGAVPVAVLALLASLSGWGLLAVLKRVRGAARPRRLDGGGRRRTGRVPPAVDR